MQKLNLYNFRIWIDKLYRQRIKILFIFYLLLIAVYTGVRIVNVVNIINNIREAGDTSVYLRMASYPIRSVLFWGGTRPFTVPLLYKILNSNFTLIAISQLFFSALCWIFLAVQIRKKIHSAWLKEISFIIILLFSLSENIIGWDTVMLSESISVSLMVLFLASWLWILNGWNWQKIIFLSVVAFFWMFSRETNSWIILTIAGITAAIGIMKKFNRKYFAFTGIFLLFFIANEISFNLGNRWVFPFLNILTQRILPQPQYTAFFSDNGMPITPALIRMSGLWASSDNWAFYRDPALEDFRKWLYKNGESTYIKWLLSRPYETIKEPVVNIKQLLSFKGKDYFTYGFSPVLPVFVDSIIYPNDHLNFVVLYLCFIIFIVIYMIFVKKVYISDPIWILLLSIILMIYPHAFLIWHGDAMEIGRHSLQLGIQFFLCAWIVILFTGDYIFCGKLKKELNKI
jgi:hypothetical protein